MSYTILYKSMFVKLSDGKYIPMMETGANNVYEAKSCYGRARRGRSWCNVRLCGDKMFLTEDDILNGLNELKEKFETDREKDRHSEDEYNRKTAEEANFGYYLAISLYGKTCWNTTFADVKRVVMGGVRDSISIHQAINDCGLHLNYYEKVDGNPYSINTRTFNFRSEEELCSFIEEHFGEDNCYYLAFDSNKAGDYYAIKKAVKGFTKLNGKMENFKVECYDVEAKKYYITINENGLALADNIGEGMWFNKQKSNGVDLSTLIFRTFRGKINHISIRFKSNLENVCY